MSQLLLKSLLSESSLSWKEIPDAEREEGLKLIEEHNKNPSIEDDIKAYYAIDVTGKHQAYYTFWRFRLDIDPKIAAYVKNPIYFGNLTTDFLSSVKKAISIMPVTAKLQVWTDGTREHLIGKSEVFTFGKYRGEPYPEVYLRDPAYFAFLAKNSDPKYANSKSNIIIRSFADMYYEEQTKKNREASTSKFVGKEGDRFEGELKIYNIQEKEGQAFGYGDKPKPYKAYKMIDAEGNKFVASNVDKVFPNAQKDDVIKLRGIIRGHKELMGIKFTALGYIKAA